MSVRLFFDPHRVEQLRQQGISPPNRPSSSKPAGGKPAPEPRTLFEFELIEDRARLRAEVDRLKRDNQRLSAEVSRLSGAPAPRSKGRALKAPEPGEDDAAKRLGLSLLEDP